MALHYKDIPGLPSRDELVDHHLPYYRDLVGREVVAKLAYHFELVHPITLEQHQKLDMLDQNIGIAYIGLQRTLKDIRTHHQHMS